MQIDPLEAIRRADAAAERAGEARKAALRAALVAAHGRLGDAAQTLGMSYATIRRHVAAAGLTEWLAETYPVGERQPAFQSGKRPKGSGRKKIHKRG